MVSVSGSGITLKVPKKEMLTPKDEHSVIPLF